MALEHLRAAVLDARTEHELEAIHDRGGPSAGWIRRLENYRDGEPAWRVRPATLKSLDVGLQWEPGTARALYDERPERTVVVRDVEHLAQILADRLVDRLVDGMRLRFELADA